MVFPIYDESPNKIKLPLEHQFHSSKPIIRCVQCALIQNFNLQILAQSIVFGTNNISVNIYLPIQKQFELIWQGT